MGSGGSWLTPWLSGCDQDQPADCRPELGDDLADGGREDVDAAHDQHVVGAADAAQPRRGAAARAGRGPDLDMVAGAETQQRRSPVTQMREHEFAARAVLHADRGPGLADRSSSAWTMPRPPRCMPFWCSHSPHSETPMSPMPIASVTLAPQPSSSLARMAGSPPPGSPADHHARHAEDPLRSKSRSAAHSIRCEA